MSHILEGLNQSPPLVKSVESEVYSNKPEESQTFLLGLLPPSSGFPLSSSLQLPAMPETVEELNTYLAARYSRPRDEDIPSSSRSTPAFALAGLEPSPKWEEATRAYHARLS